MDSLYTINAGRKAEDEGEDNMSLKEEIGKIEQEEEFRRRERVRIDQRVGDKRQIVGLYRRIDAIVDYIDKGEGEEEPLTEEKMWQRGFNAGYKEALSNRRTEEGTGTEASGLGKQIGYV